MNICTFTGYLLETPVVIPTSGGYNARFCRFDLITYEYVRNKNGEKKRYPTTLKFQAWDSGADAISKLGKKGMKMTVQASAKNADENGDIIFRVNQFDFGCLDKD